jgi:hypothetical protein
VKDEKGCWVTSFHGILAMWRNHFSQLLNIHVHVHGVNYVRQKKIHTTESLVPEPSALKVELVIQKLKRLKSSGINQIAAELITAGGKKFSTTSINLLCLFGIRRNCLRIEKSRPMYPSIKER